VSFIYERMEITAILRLLLNLFVLCLPSVWNVRLVFALTKGGINVYELSEISAPLNMWFQRLFFSLIYILIPIAHKYLPDFEPILKAIPIVFFVVQLSAWLYKNKVPILNNLKNIFDKINQKVKDTFKWFQSYFMSLVKLWQSKILKIQNQPKNKGSMKGQIKGQMKVNPSKRLKSLPSLKPLTNPNQRKRSSSPSIYDKALGQSLSKRDLL
jgi:hypothetical protein